jgi:non-ribosomal peptide synthetase component F
MSLTPARTLAQSMCSSYFIPSRGNDAFSLAAEAILCAPGNLHELETKIINGCQYRTYKNLWPSIRQFWLSCVAEHADKIYIVFEDQRLSYREVHERALKAAGIFRHVYNIKKGETYFIGSYPSVYNYPNPQEKE